MANSTKAWLNFEDEVCESVKRAIATGYLPFDRNNSSVQRKAVYPTIDGKRTIAIEVSVEVYRRNASEPCLISLWECKHKGKRKVEVSVVRELISKIHEIGIGRCTGAVVTTNGFQNGAIELAQTHGIALFNLEKNYRLFSVMKYAKGAETEEREVPYASYSLDAGGRTHSDTMFYDLIRLHFRQSIAKCRTTPLDSE